MFYCRFLTIISNFFPGHSSGAVQMWDLTTALSFFDQGKPTSGCPVGTAGGPTTEEMVRLLDHLELSNSRTSTPCCVSPSPSMQPNNASLRLN